MGRAGDRPEEPRPAVSPSTGALGMGRAGGSPDDLRPHAVPQQARSAWDAPEPRPASSPSTGALTAVLSKVTSDNS